MLTDPFLPGTGPPGLPVVLLPPWEELRKFLFLSSTSFIPAVLRELSILICLPLVSFGLQNYFFLKNFFWKPAFLSKKYHLI